MKDNQCPGGCGRRPRVGHPLCVRCWRRLSPRRRSELYSCWRAANANLSSDVFWSDYLRARRLAVHELRQVSTC